MRAFPFLTDPRLYHQQIFLPRSHFGREPTDFSSGIQFGTRENLAVSDTYGDGLAEEA